jgi:hypothetical protein
VDEEIAEKERLQGTLIDASIEGWRLCRTFARLISKLDASEAAKYGSQIRYYLKRVEAGLADAGFTLVSLEGQPYDVGMAATALNLDEFGEDDELLVEQMVEPVIMGPDGVRRPGVVMVKRIGT